METIAFIPARGGSQSIQNKNIKLLGGKPLISWVIGELEKVSKVDQIVVATDDQQIVSIVNNLGISKVEIYHRSKENASNTASTESVMLEYLAEANLNANINFMLVQATSPFTTAKDFDAALNLLEKENVDSILSCTRIKRFIWKENGTPINYDYSARPRRQNFKGTLIENGAIYINSVQNILEHKNRISGKISIYEMPEYTSLELDEPDDWELAEKHIVQHEDYQTTKEIKLLLSDVDGVLTDAGMYYSEKGDEWKKFNTYDGFGFRIAKEAGIKVGIITSEKVDLNKRRAQKMQLDYILQGVNNKLDTVSELSKKLNISMDDIAYIGDDINDKYLLKKVGMAACPTNAQKEIKSISGIIQLTTAGGDGVLREFVELILAHRNRASLEI